MSDLVEQLRGCDVDANARSYLKLKIKEAVAALEFRDKEIERLRAALAQIAKECDEPAASIAREALGQKEAKDV